MGIIAERLAQIAPSPTMAVGAEAARLRSAGRKVISLGAGEPDFPTPPEVCRAAIAAIGKGETKYTPVGGAPALKRAIVAKFQRENGLSFDEEEVTASSGAKQVLYNCLQALVNPGDEVLIPSPYWVSYPAMAQLAGGTAVIIATSGDHKLSPVSLRKALTPKSKVLILNSPSNPGGAVYGKEELAALGEVVAEHPQLHVISDDIYEHIIYEGEFYTLAQLTGEEMAERIITVNGVSKAYAMTGWRIGYGASKNRELIKAMEKLQSQSSSNPCSISQAAATAALNGDQSFLAERAAAFKKRRDSAIKILNACERLECEPPPGAFYLFVKCRLEGSAVKDDLEYAGYLLREAEVAVVPGTAFGCPGYFRISYALKDEELRRACLKIVEASQRLRAATAS